MGNKILIAATIIYLIILHVFIFFLYFEKVEFDNEMANYLYVFEDSEHYFYASSTKKKMFYEHGCHNCLLVRENTSVSIEGDIAIIQEVNQLYESIIWNPENRNFYWGKPAKRYLNTQLAFVRGKCLVINDYDPMEGFDPKNSFFKNFGCDFKDQDNPIHVYRIIEKGNSIILE